MEFFVGEIDLRMFIASVKLSIRDLSVEEEVPAGRSITYRELNSLCVGDCGDSGRVVVLVVFNMLSSGSFVLRMDS